MTVYRGRVCEITALPAAWEYWRPMDLTLEELIKSLFKIQEKEASSPREQWLKEEILKRVQYLDTVDSIYFSVCRPLKHNWTVFTVPK